MAIHLLPLKKLSRFENIFKIIRLVECRTIFKLKFIHKLTPLFENCFKELDKNLAVLNAATVDQKQ